MDPEALCVTFISQMESWRLSRTSSHSTKPGTPYLEGIDMAFGDKTLEELYEQLRKVERERDAKGPRHPDFRQTQIMIDSIRKAIKRKTEGDQ